MKYVGYLATRGIWNVDVQSYDENIRQNMEQIEVWLRQK